MSRMVFTFSRCPGVRLWADEEFLKVFLAGMPTGDVVQGYSAFALCLSDEGLLLIGDEGRWRLPGGEQSWQPNANDRLAVLASILRAEFGLELEAIRPQCLSSILMGPSGATLREFYLLRVVPGRLRSGQVFPITQLPAAITPECATGIDMLLAGQFSSEKVRR